jgi:hypothetical protein
MRIALRRATTARTLSHLGLDAALLVHLDQAETVLY